MENLILEYKKDKLPQETKFKETLEFRESKKVLESMKARNTKENIAIIKDELKQILI